MPGRSGVSKPWGDSHGSEATGRNASEPTDSLEKTMVRPSLWRGGEGNTGWEESVQAPVCSPGVIGTARREGKALNTGDLDRRGLQPRTVAQGVSRGQGAGPGVGWVRSTEEGDESRWREGALLEEATAAGKERRLWRH